MPPLTVESDVAGFRFDPNDPDFDVDPFPTYAFMRRYLPVYWWEDAGGFVVTRHRDVQLVLTDRRFSAELRHYPSMPESLADDQLNLHQRLAKYGLFWMADADHHRVRRIATPLFTPRAVQWMRAQFAAVADELLEARPEGDDFDVVTDFAARYPLEAIIHILGIPRHQHADFRLFGSAVIDAFYPAIDTDALAEKMDFLPAGIAMLDGIMEERARHPGPDFLSRLIHAEEAGDRLTCDELRSMVALMISAGCEPPRHLITFAVLNLLRHPDQLALLRGHPRLLRNAVYEAGRYDSFGKLNLPRFTLEDLEIADVPIRSGQAVYGVFASTLRDPDAFPHADRFDIQRSPSGNVLYGDGPHNCLGKSVARLMVEEAVRSIIRHFPQLRLAGQPCFTRNTFFRKIVSLPVSVTRA